MSNNDKLQSTPRVVAHPDKDPDLFLCCGDGEGTHEFKVCRGYKGVADFYEQMCGRDQDDTLDSLKSTFEDPEEWRNDGAALKLELYCARFYVWKVSAAELAMPGADPSAMTESDADGKRIADANLKALLTYTTDFYSAAMEHGMKRGETANAIAHVESAARALHRLAISRYVGEKDG